MTATAVQLPTRRLLHARGWLAPAALVAGLAIVVAARWLATRAGLDPLAVGAAFGIALLAVAVARPRVMRTHGCSREAWPDLVLERRRTIIGLAVGAVFGLALVGLVVAGAALSGSVLVPGLGRPAAPFLPWAAITIVVAAGEEAVLRGRLLGAVRGVAGLVPAILVTTVAFALMHVPLYGWHVVPLDLAVGFAFAGLRLATRSLAASIAAHAVADLATWWL